MAGIGFQLKKLYNHKSIFLDFRTLMYSSVIIVGPQVLCIAAIAFFQTIMLLSKVSFADRRLFLASTLYCFIFSQIITSGFSMIVTRYISDKLFAKEYGKILPSLYGVITICVFISGIIGALFFLRSPINAYTKFFTYILFIELVIMWLETSYLSALKDYTKIVKSFLIGLVTAAIIGTIILKASKINPIQISLFSFDIGIFIIVTLLMFYIRIFFKSNEGEYFDFLKYIDRYYSLFIICVFYTLALYIHNFIFWGGDLKEVVLHTYTFATVYDVPTFYALLTTFPASIIFSISLETSFYGEYKEYYSQIILGGSLKDIKNAREDMILVLYQEIFRLMEIQLFFSIVFLALGHYLLPFIGLSQISIDIFKILTLGAYCSISMFTVILIDLYFENRKGAVISTSTFLILNTIFTLVSLKLGQNYYGVGYFLAAFISLIVALINLNGFLNDIDYITFCSQPIIYKEKTGIFTAIVNKLY
ncbi:exopolysaccharide Pel transporter PelG [Clostridium felsineum]|uniref:exopolysaccharide Pel transporter PelG n=1 Tax=Clostridium felsineum TaxID=36839 RepID=UPI00098C75A8|nr:exopolysaccharide Pel transporter PelG [Clostridium felsineum]URZ01656.1 hypothetical protein CLAUR_016510 [Clostridium felsineum]